MQLFFNCLGFVLQLMLCEGAFVLGESRRKHFYFRFFISFAVCSLIVWLTSLLPVSSPIIVNVYFILMFFLTMGIFLCSFRISVMDALFFCTGGYAIQHAVYNAVGILLFFTGMPDTSKPGGVIFTWLIINITPYVLASFLSYFIFMRKLRKNNLFGRKNLGVIVLSLVILFTTIFMSSLKNFDYRGLEINTFTSRVVCGVFSILCCSVALIMQIIILNMDKAISDREKQKYIAKQTRKQYSISSEIFEAVNIKFHDIKHQISLLEIMDESKRKKAISEIMKSVENFSALVKTDNPVLNVVLTEKSLLCKQNHIKLNCVVGCDFSFFDELDLYTMFSNALDNAIQSAMKQEGEKRCIELYIRKEKEMSFINIYNYYSGEIRFLGGLPLTGGDKLYHGYGTRSIAEIVKRYNGEFLMMTEGDKFRLSITFPQT